MNAIRHLEKQTLSQDSTLPEEVVLSVDSVSKKYCRNLKTSLWYGVKDICNELLGTRENIQELREGEFWAIDKVSFRLERGESLGLVGSNGAGKTTLIRLISGLVRPDNGKIAVRGRVAPLIALNAGFSPILTGKENIYINMSILGLSKREIDERLEEVIAFAEIGDALNAPVRSYSSGMVARLGFSCAVFTDPDILLIDEVLAVGDIRFRSKCYQKLAEMRKKKTSFLLVSHSSTAIFTACERAVYLSQGNLVLEGDVSSVMTRYEKDMNQRKLYINNSHNKHLGNSNSEKSTLQINEISFKTVEKDKCRLITTGKSARLCIDVVSEREISEVDIHISFYRVSESESILFLSSMKDGEKLQIPNGKSEISMYMENVGLKPGNYRLVTFIRQSLLETIGFSDSFSFRVEAMESMEKCTFYQPRDWKIKQNSPEET